MLTIGQTKTVDQSYETAKTNYDSFVQSVTTLKAHVDGWAASAKAMCISSEHVGNDFKHVMQALSTFVPSSFHPLLAPLSITGPSSPLLLAVPFSGRSSLCLPPFGCRHPFSALANEGKAVQNAIYKASLFSAPFSCSSSDGGCFLWLQHFEMCEKQLEATANQHFKQLTTHFNHIKVGSSNDLLLAPLTFPLPSRSLTLS